MESPIREQQTASNTEVENKHRLNRMSFIYSSLFVAVPVILGVIIDSALGYQNPAELNFQENGLAPFTLGALLLALVYTVIISIKRLHDIDASAGWTALLFVPFVSIGLSLSLMIYPGTKGANTYGPQPTRRYVYLFR